MKWIHSPAAVIARRRYQARRYAEKVAERLCVRAGCSEPAAKGRRCERHAADRAYHQQRYEMRREGAL